MAVPASHSDAVAKPGLALARLLCLAAAAFTLASAAIHFAVIGAHFGEWWVAGAFFAVIAWLQIGWAVAIVMRPSRGLQWAGAAGSAGVVAVWAVSRVFGIPLGPEAWVPESIAWADLLATAFEAATVACALLCLSPRRIRAVVPSAALPAVAAVLVLLVVPTTTASLVQYSGHADHDEAAAVAEPVAADAAPAPARADERSGHGEHGTAAQIGLRRWHAVQAWASEGWRGWLLAIACYALPWVAGLALVLRRARRDGPSGIPAGPMTA